MAARSTSGFYHLVLILIILQLVNCNYGAEYGNTARRLQRSAPGKSYVVQVPNFPDDDDKPTDETSSSRNRRDVPEFPDNNPNITTKVSTVFLPFPTKYLQFFPSLLLLLSLLLLFMRLVLIFCFRNCETSRKKKKKKTTKRLKLRVEIAIVIANCVGKMMMRLIALVGCQKEIQPLQHIIIRKCMVSKRFCRSPRFFVLK